jgi:hypothetical protein
MNIVTQPLGCEFHSLKAGLQVSLRIISLLHNSLFARNYLIFKYLITNSELETRKFINYRRILF